MKTPTSTINFAYHAQFAAAQERLVEIKKLLAIHQSNQKKGSYHWGHVGDIAEVNQRLIQVLDFLK